MYDHMNEPDDMLPIFLSEATRLKVEVWFMMTLPFIELRCWLLTKQNEYVWATQLEPSNPILTKVMISKALSFHAGKTMLSPSAGTTMCCYFCPWMCGCTKHMPIQGCVPIEVAGTSAACLIVAGAPLGSTDLQIAEELLTAAGFTKTDGTFKKGGAPDSAEMTR